MGVPADGPRPCARPLRHTQGARAGTLPGREEGVTVPRWAWLLVGLLVGAVAVAVPAGLWLRQLSRAWAEAWGMPLS